MGAGHHDVVRCLPVDSAITFAGDGSPARDASRTSRPGRALTVGEAAPTTGTLIVVKGAGGVGVVLSG